MAGTRLMIVEDEGIVRKDLAERLRGIGYDVVAAVATAAESLAKAEALKPDLVLMDIMLDGAMDGIDAAEQIFGRFNIPVMYLTAYADAETLQRAKLTGPYGYILKPFEEREIVSGIETALYKHKMENRIRESEEKYRTLVESLQQAIVTVDRNGVVLFLNNEGAKELGGKPADYIGKTMHEIFPQEYADNQLKWVQQVIDSDQGMTGESETIVGGRKRWYQTSIQPLKHHSGMITVALVVANDISERKQAEQALQEAYKKLQDTQQQLIHSSKMTAMGQLAAGISHELNQPLTGIRGFAQVALLDIEPQHKVRADLQKIVDQTERMEKIIQNVRSFARKTDFKVQACDLNRAVEDSLSLLKAQLKVHNIRMRVELQPDLPHVLGDLNQLQQVLINLITNARDAIESVKRPEPGEILVRTVGLQQAHAAQLQVADNGCGIPQEQMESIFNPFFTTKSPSGGLGLGLSIVYRIIENHKGSISVESVVGKGTTFTILLPVSP
ncbi:MAG TPA: ATP-binding protein [Candidatus Omnitrophota bacterium]|nr:ATP-binding protein [Candidatus Omnitrophota bacterium]HRZ14148.1 ATP-binding protein [Candidatus Omnitrophota bacterium]